MTGRDDKGRFVPGNKIGKNGGRPPRTVEEDFVAAFKSAVTARDIVDAVTILKGKVRSGDLKAIELFLSYALGKPSQEFVLSGGDTPIDVSIGIRGVDYRVGLADLAGRSTEDSDAPGAD